MEKLLWLDGHVTTISAKEAFRWSREEITDDGYVLVLPYYDVEFEWDYDMCVWVQR